MKKLKKVVTLALAMFMLVSLLAPAAFAAEDEMVVAYVQVPEDWQAPSIWAWDDDGKNAFDAWPGEEAAADPGNAGWYYCWIPAWATNIIVSANESGVQTEGFAVEGKNVWITVASAEEVTTVYDPLTKGEAPAYVEKIAVHAKVPDSWTEANLWAWLHPDGTGAFAAWPGEAMKLDNGWYSAKAPAWVNSIIVNAGDGNPQTEDLTIEPREVWLVVAEDGTAEIAYANPDLAVANITVRVKAPEDWKVPCLWAWSHPDGNNAFSAWPGEALVDDAGWLTLEAPGWINRVIVNANEGGIQTGDIDVEVGKDVWVVVADAENYTVTYEEPGETAPPPSSIAPSSVSQPDAAKGDGTMTWIIIAAGVAVVLIIVVVLVVRKKKKAD